MMLDFDSSTAPHAQFQTGSSEPVKNNPLPKEPTVGDRIRHLVNTNPRVQENMRRFKTMKYLVKNHPKKYKLEGDGSYIAIMEGNHTFARVMIFSLDSYYCSEFRITK